MKHLAHIAVAVTTLIVMLFGAGGVGLMTCACSGDTSLILPLDEGCCGSDRSCMSVTIVRMANSQVAATLEVPADQIVGELARQHDLGGLVLELPADAPCASLPLFHSPPPGRLSMVMRV